MPVASLHNVTSPVRDGMEGVVANAPEELRQKIVDLLDNPAKAIKLGEGARLRVEKEFAISDFQRAWGSLAEELVRR
jgi:glycosyltransferase involved in cell wall biosynthesis